MTPAERLRQRIADENFEELLELLAAVENLSVDRDDFEPDAEPAEGADIEEWKDHAGNLHDLASEIDDKLCDAVALADGLAKMAANVRRNLGL